MGLRRQLKQYYTINAEKIFNEVTHPQFRVWRLRRLNGKFKQNDRVINTVEKLRTLLTSGYYDRVYVSVGKFYCPQKNYGKYHHYFKNKKDTERNVGPRSCNVVADNIFLGSDMFFDIDHQDLRIALAETRMILERMKNEKQYKLEKIQYSGGKGFHIIYTDKRPITHAEHPRERIEAYKKKRMKLITKILKLKLTSIDELHCNVLSDQNRVHSATYSLKPDSGRIVTKFTYDDIMKHTASELFEIVQIPGRACSGKGSSTSFTTHAASPMTRVVHQEIKLPAFPHHRHPEPGSERTGISSYPTTYQFIDNLVYGTRMMYIPVIRHKGAIKANRLRKAQKRYNLPTWYTLKVGKDIFVSICFKIVDYTRLVKIMRYCKAENLKTFTYRKHAWIIVSPKFKANQKISEAPKMYKIMRRSTRKETALSAPHLAYFKSKYDFKFRDNEGQHALAGIINQPLITAYESG